MATFAPIAFHYSTQEVLSSPSITTAHHFPSTSPDDVHSRQNPAPSHSSRMNLFTSPSKYSLQVQLPLSICPEMVTISANKGDKLKVIANAWHIEHGSRYEWNIAFPPRDVNISDVHAKFDPDGRLTIDVHRINPLHMR